MVLLTHSLTHCCAWPAEGRSVLHIERSWPAFQVAPTDRPVSSSNCCSQFLRGRPGGCFQSAAGGVPVWASIDSCSACKAGVFSSRRQMWPNNEWRLSAIRDGTKRLVVSFSHWLLRWIPCHTIWYQGYDAVPACEKTGSCHCLLCALSTFHNHITLPTAQVNLYSVHALHSIGQTKTYLTDGGRKWCVHRASKSNSGVVWLWLLISWPSKLTISSSCYKIGSLNFENIVFARLVTNGEIENITPLLSKCHKVHVVVVVRAVVVIVVVSHTHTIGRSTMPMSREGGKFLGRLVEYDVSASKPNCSNTITITSQSSTQVSTYPSLPVIRRA